MGNFLEALFWIIIGLVLSVLFHFLYFFISRKHKKEKIKLEELKKSNPNESYSQREYFIGMTDIYVRNLLIAKYVFIGLTILVLVRYLVIGSVSEPIG